MDAYFDLFSGISGNMVLGALVDLGLNLEKWKDQLSKLGLEDEYDIETKKTDKSGIGATYVEVKLTGHHHEHSHGRNLDDIRNIIDNSDLNESVKEKSKEIFLNLAQAEAKIHGSDINEIHFHEVGAVDAIVDIVGSVLGMEMLNIDKIYASKVHTGTGFVNCEHGKMPVPAPATMELLAEIPIYSKGIEAEMVTPTGAAIINTLAEQFGSRDEMQIVKSGYGAGSRDLPIPNLLRVNLIKGFEEKQKKTQ